MGRPSHFRGSKHRLTAVRSKINSESISSEDRETLSISRRPWFAGNDSGQGKIILFYTKSRPLLRTTPRVKQPGLEAHHSRSSTIEVKNDAAVHPLPHVSSWHRTNCFKHRDNLTLHLPYCTNSYRTIRKQTSFLFYIANGRVDEASKDVHLTGRIWGDIGSKGDHSSRAA
jgi:hypothetical protein